MFRELDSLRGFEDVPAPAGAEHPLESAIVILRAEPEEARQEFLFVAAIIVAWAHEGKRPARLGDPLAIGNPPDAFVRRQTHAETFDIGDGNTEYPGRRRDETDAEGGGVEIEEFLLLRHPVAISRWLLTVRCSSISSLSQPGALHSQPVLVNQSGAEFLVFARLAGFPGQNADGDKLVENFRPAAGAAMQTKLDLARRRCV